MEDLNNKLKTVSKSKQSAVEAAEVWRERKNKLLQEQNSQKHLGNVTRKDELQQAREQYLATAAELDVAKKYLNKIRQDFDVALEAKFAAFQQAAEALRSANMNAEKVSEVLKEISAMKKSIQQLNLASQQAERAQANIAVEKETRIQTCKTSKDEAVKQLLTLKNDYDPELTRTIEAKLADTIAAMEFLQDEMRNVHTLKMDHVRVVTKGLDDEATRALQEVAEEESSLQSLVSTLKLELKNVKRKKQAGEQNESDQLLLAAEKACREAEELQRTTEELNDKAETAQIRAVEAESKLQLALKEVEEASEAEKRVHDEIKFLSVTQQTPLPDSPAKLKINKEKFESSKGKQEECNNLTEMKVAAVMVQLEMINANKDEAEEKLETSLNAIDEIKEATDIALKVAENASICTTYG